MPLLLFVTFWFETHVQSAMTKQDFAQRAEWYLKDPMKIRMEVCDKTKYFCNKIGKPVRFKIEMIGYLNGILRAFKAKKDNKDLEMIENLEEKIWEMKEMTGDDLCDYAERNTCPQ